MERSYACFIVHGYDCFLRIFTYSREFLPKSVPRSRITGSLSPVLMHMRFLFVEMTLSEPMFTVTKEWG